MKNFNSFFNSLVAMPKRLAMVLTVLFTLGVGSMCGAETTYTFTNSNWNAKIGSTSANWTNGKAGAGFANNGVQVTTNATGAYATSPKSFENISQIIVTYNTNKDSGAGTLKIKVGDNTEKSNTCGYSGSSDGRTANFTSTFNFSPTQSGSVKLTVNTATNSIYVVSVKIITEDVASCTEISPNLSYSPSSLDIGNTANPTLTGNTGSGTVTYSSSNDAVATVNSSTGVVTAVAAGSATITASIAAKGSYCDGSATATITVNKQQTTITLSEAGSTRNPSGTFYVGDSYTLPSTTTATCGDKTFVGWSTVEIDNSAEKPTSNFHELGASVTLGATNTFYAVFAETGGTPTTTWPKTDIANIKSTDEVVITMSKGVTTWALRNDNGTSAAPYAESITITNEQISSKVGNVQIWNISNSSGDLTIYPKGETSAWLYCTNANNGVRVGTNTNKTFTISGNYLKNTATSRYVGVYMTNPDWRCYTSSSEANIKDQTLAFYKKTTTGGYQNYTTQCATQTHTLTASVSSLAFGNVTVNSPKELEFTLSGSNLTADATLALSGTNAGMFSVSPTPVTPSNGSITNQTITVTYTPTAKASHYATLTISSTGAESIEIPLYGTGVAQTANYTVRHYQQNITDDNYTLKETETLSGEVGTDVTPAVKSYEGFTAPTKKSVEITANGNAIVEYQYARNSYTLTWDLDGGTITTAGTTAGQVKYGAALTAPTVTKTDYTFAGWSPAVAATMPAENTTYTAQWTQLHTITWKVGSTDVLIEEVANATGVTQTPGDPANNAIGNCANAFVGWSEKSAGSTPQDAAYYDDLCSAEDMKLKHTSVTGDKTFYAVFATATTTPGTSTTTNKTYSHTITATTWDAAGERTLSNVSWALSDNGGYYGYDGTKGQQVGSGSKPAKSMTLTTSGFASASKITSVTINTSGASDTNAKVSVKVGGTSYSCNSNTSPSITTTATAYEFTGNSTGEVVISWSQTSSKAIYFKSVTVEYSNTATTPDVTTYSNYVTNCCATPVPTNGSYTSPSGTSVTLTWDGESTRYHITGNGLDDYTDDESYTVTGLTECNEYTFYVSAYPEGGCESEAIAITAQPFIGSKTVTFNYNGNGQANTTSSTSCGNTSITLPTPTYSGYRFMGWYTEANGGILVNENPYSPDADITLYAHWAKEYSVTYNENGGSTSCTGGNYIAGETVTICTTNPTKTGYTFAGWTYSPEVTITDGEFTMPASDVTITAQWTINQYTVTWKPNGGNWAGSTENIVHTYDYGAKINLPADPTRDEYRFTGWNATVAPTMPATNITYTAQWKQNYTITFHDGDDVTPWTQTKDAESINLTEYLGTLACDDYQFAGWSTDATKYDDEPANITTWVTGNYTPTANINLYAVYVKGDIAQDFALNCEGGVYEIWENGTNQHMAGRQEGGGNKFYTTEYWDQNKTGSNGAPFTITKVADQTYTLQNADGQYITGNTYDEDDLDIEDTWENADKYKWTISNGTNGTWRFTNKVSTNYALVFYSKYFQLQKATNVTNGSSYYDLELTPAASNVYQSNPNCGPYYIIFNTHGGEFIQGEYAYGEEQTGLTETTYSKFPAAELEGYTFAGWKDGSPIDDEITADNASDAPYLKQAGEDLVVSSNKTYHAVYYYYDEEEDIDFSKEFTTSIYAEVNGMKYFLAGTPSSETMSSTTDCGYVSEVTITPGTGANAGKYKITVNGVAMAPKANETDLLNGTYWWTITERSVGSGEYKISGQDRRNIVLHNSSWGHYEYNQGSEYGNNYYYPRFGKCLQHHWTSNPTLKPSLNLSGDVYVTATNARGIMATSILKVSAKQLNANEKVNITSNSNDVYFSADCTVNFVKANKPTNTLTITASPSGVIEQDIYVHYKPSTEGNGTPASVVVSANLATPNPSVTDDQTIHVRNLPAKFVIATKVGATWYALPADMSSATNPLGVVIEVDETTMTTIAPNTTTYTLWPVKTTATENDRYTNVTGAAYGDRVRFAAVNYEQKGLWANNNNNGSTIRNYAVINSLGADATAAYEWKVTTTVVDGHWQYTLQTDQNQNQNYLRYWTAASGGAKWGTYASGNAELYFLPVTTYTDLDLEVMEWGTNSMVIRAGEDLPQNVNITINGTTTSKTLQNINGSDLYKIDDVTLTSDDCGTIIIDNGSNARKIIRKPLLVSGNKSGLEYITSPGRDICADCDIVILNGGKLTADEAKSTGSHVDFANIYVYPGGKLVLDGKSLGVKQQVYLRGGYSWLNQSTYALPEVYLNGEINFNGSNNIIYDYYIQNYKYYQFALPYTVPLANVTDEAGVDDFPVWVKHYNGALRAADAYATSWEWYYGNNFERGEGYIIAAQPRQITGVKNRPLSIIRFPLGNKVFNTTNGLESDLSITTKAHGIDGYKAGTVTANNVGWNFVGNPFLSTWKGDIGYKQLTKYPNEANWDGTYDWVDADIKYITIMSAESGSDYAQYIASETELKPFFPFYLQETAVGGSGTINFATANRIKKAPAELYADEPREAFVQIEIITDGVEDQTGLFISDTYSDNIDFNDYEKMFGSSSDRSKLWFVHEDKRMAFEAMTEASAAANIALGYRAPKTGTYTFAINEDVSALNEIVGVYLTDHELGVSDYNLLYNTYEFETEATNYNDKRFTIRIVLSDDSNGVVTGVDNIGTMKDGIYKFFYQDKMYIYNSGIIYDGTGKRVTNINK